MASSRGCTPASFFGCKPQRFGGTGAVGLRNLQSRRSAWEARIHDGKPQRFPRVEATATRAPTARVARTCDPFYFRTTDVTGAIELPKDKEMVMPGDNVTITVKLIAPIAMEEGLRFAIREGGRTVGAGVVAKIME